MVTIYQNMDDIRDVKPDLILVRNFARYVSGKLEIVPDF